MRNSEIFTLTALESPRDNSPPWWELSRDLETGSLEPQEIPLPIKPM